MSYKSENIMSAIGGGMSELGNVIRANRLKDEQMRAKSSELALSQINEDLKYALQSGDTSGMYDALARKEAITKSLFNKKGTVQALPAQAPSQDLFSTLSNDLGGGIDQYYKMSGLGQRGKNMATVSDWLKQKTQLELQQEQANLEKTQAEIGGKKMTPNQEANLFEKISNRISNKYMLLNPDDFDSPEVQMKMQNEIAITAKKYNLSEQYWKKPEEKKLSKETTQEPISEEMMQVTLQQAESVKTDEQKQQMLQRIEVLKKKGKLSSEQYEKIKTVLESE